MNTSDRFKKHVLDALLNARMRKWMISAQSPNKNVAGRSPPTINSLRLAIHAKGVNERPENEV